MNRSLIWMCDVGMVEEAELLYRDCSRFDLLNKLFQVLCQSAPFLPILLILLLSEQARGEWEKAVEIAESRDRIHLKNT